MFSQLWLLISTTELCTLPHAIWFNIHDVQQVKFPCHISSSTTHYNHKCRSSTPMKYNYFSTQSTQHWVLAFPTIHKQPLALLHYYGIDGLPHVASMAQRNDSPTMQGQGYSVHGPEIPSEMSAATHVWCELWGLRFCTKWLHVIRDVRSLPTSTGSLTQLSQHVTVGI